MSNKISFLVGIAYRLERALKSKPQKSTSVEETMTRGKLFRDADRTLSPLGRGPGQTPDGWSCGLTLTFQSHLLFKALRARTQETF